MRPWLSTLPILLGLLFLQLAPAFAQEERKPLEQILLEKGVITVDEAASVQKQKLSKWVDRLTLSGDFRLRHESFMNNPQPDRHRQRFRLRLASEYRIGDFLVGVRLASGTGEQVSTNQSFDNLFTQKQIWIDRAYLQWSGLSWLTLTGGRMANPFFTIYTTDAVWDDDLNPEGFAENLNFKPSDQINLFANIAQFVLDEDSTDNNDQWLFGEQAGAQVSLTKDTKATLAAAFYGFRNIQRGDVGQASGAGSGLGVVQDGNSRVSANGQVRSAFRVLDITAELAMKMADLPVAIQGDYVQNLSAAAVGPKTSKEGNGYQFGLKVGKASDANTWELAYYYKLLETDAVFADLADSDFGNGGTNRKGHIFWGAYNLTSALQFKTKMFRTHTENEQLPPGNKDITRLQVDLVMKF
jgi:hypothetical protein